MPRAAVFLASLFFLPISVQASQPIDVVICLDTSGSMDGLLDSAKRKLWSVVNDMAKIDPAPSLRVGLYSYGNNSYDASRGFVRKETELTSDLDEVYKKLNGLRIASAGSEEYVARVTRAAVAELKWSDDAKALRLVFVCGNEPVDQDKEVTLASVAEAANAKGISINTIYCGSLTHLDAEGWKQFASKCTGKFAAIDQDKARVEVIATPFDADLEKLSSKINETYLFYGARGALGGANQVAQDSNAKAIPGAAAERAITKATPFYRNAEIDLIDRAKSDKAFDVKKLKDTELPEEMRKLKPEEREGYLKKKATEREEIQKKMTELGQKRALYLETERKKLPASPGEQAFDAALRTIVRDQAAGKGIKFKN